MSRCARGCVCCLIRHRTTMNARMKRAAPRACAGHAPGGGYPVGTSWPGECRQMSISESHLRINTPLMGTSQETSHVPKHKDPTR
jgi:hypothetical protein